MRSVLLALLLVTSGLFFLSPASGAEPVSLGRSRQLFLDDRLIASSKGLRRVWHSPEKFSGNPVLKREKSWEGSGPYTYGTVHFDAQSRTFKLWYNCYVGKQPDSWVCYATSKDGIHWDRPSLNVVSDPRLRPGNNVVLMGSGLPQYRQCLSPSVLYRPKERDPQRRYAMVYWDINAGGNLRFLGLCLAFSPDGIRWTNVRNNPVFDGCSDVTDACYDAARDRYLLHYKLWRVEGNPVASEGTGGRVGKVSYWCAWNEVPLAGGKVRFRGKLVHHGSEEPKVVTAVVDYARPPAYRRVVARAESTDLVHWTRARPVLELPQQGDPPGLSTYGMSVFPYEGRYLGLLRVFHNEREIDLHLAYSDDDLTWRRAPGRKPFIGLGREGTHDAGMVFSSNGSLVVGDELWFYYGAFTGDHAQADDRQRGSICLAKLRRDGFVSLDAGKETGELVTVPLRVYGERLSLNAAAKEGEVRVEVRDERGRPRPGFTFGDSKPFREDAVSHPIAWRDGENLSSLKGQTIQLGFQLRQARLYAFQVSSGTPK